MRAAFGLSGLQISNGRSNQIIKHFVHRGYRFLEFLCAIHTMCIYNVPTHWPNLIIFSSVIVLLSSLNFAYKTWQALSDINNKCDMINFISVIRY